MSISLIGMALTAIQWLLIAVTVLLAICFVYDKQVRPKHKFAAVRRPKQLAKLKVMNEMVPTTTLHIPADPSQGDPTTSPVLFLIPGNPGVAEFYIDMMQTLHELSQRRLHIYCVGHAGQGLIINDSTLGTSDDLPPFDFDRPVLDKNITATYSNPFKPGQLYNLRKQIMHKLEALNQIRKLHPRASGFLIAGHSVGAHISLEVLRTLENLETFVRERRDAPRGSKSRQTLNARWDAMVSKHYVESEEQYRKAVQEGKVRQGFASGQNNTLFESEYMEQWSDLALSVASSDAQSQSIPWLKQVHLLCPTVHRIAYTPNGYFFTPVFQFPFVVDAVLGLLRLLPGFVKRTILSFSVSPTRQAPAYAAARLMLHSASLHNITHMAKTEMREIGDVDQSLIKRNAHRLRFYFSGKDGWVPTEFITVCTTYPGCEKTIPHAFNPKDDVEHAFVMCDRDMRMVAQYVWEQFASSQ